MLCHMFTIEADLKMDSDVLYFHSLSAAGEFLVLLVKNILYSCYDVNSSQSDLLVAISRLYNWSCVWQLQIAIEKCFVCTNNTSGTEFETEKCRIMCIQKSIEESGIVTADDE